MHAGMARLLTLLMMITLVVANGSAAAGAICRHRDAQAHAIARQSHDAKIAATALTEEAAAALHAKKGALGGAAVSLPAYIVPSAAPTPAPNAAEPMRSARTEPVRLPDRAIPPLLEPPAA